MFTGLVQDMGKVHSVDKARGDLRLEIETSLPLADMAMGASVCCSGCCLTVVEKKEDSFFVDVSAETLSKTVLGDWVVGTRLNLEPSLRVGDELGGHFVSGHVDEVTRIRSIARDGDSHRLEIEIPQGYASYIAQKGSVALDGVSLTVNEVREDFFGINLIPHTWEKTTLGLRKEMDTINIEIDMLARYVARMVGKDLT
jgi:riboflavin synthase